MSEEKKVQVSPSVEHAMRFFDSMSNSRAITDYIMKYTPGLFESALSLIYGSIGHHEIPDQAKVGKCREEYDATRRERENDEVRRRIDEPPKPEEDLFG